MSFYEQLAQTFPEGDVPPYDVVLIVPAQAFKQEWREQLQKENVQIFTNSYNGRICFFLRKKSPQSNSI